MKKLLFAFIFVMFLISFASARYEYNWGFGAGTTSPDADSYRGQNFTIGADGTNENFVINKIGLVGSKNLAGDDGIIRVDIRSDLNGANLSTGTFNFTSVGTSAQWFNVTLSDYVLSANTMYYFIVTNVSGSLFNLNLNQTNTYSGGVRVFTDNGGATWQTNTAQDMNFELFGTSGVIITLNSPANNTAHTSAITFNASVSTTFGNLTNATLWIWNSTGGIINQTTNTLLGNPSNSTIWSVNNFNIGNHKWNVYGCATNSSTSACAFNSENRTFFYGFINNSANFNSSVSETSREGFVLNITIPTGVILGNSYLNYNGTNYLTSNSNDGLNQILSTSLDIPAINGTTTKNIFWNITLVSSQGTTYFQVGTYNQIVNPIFFGICNTTYATQSINFTIYDETTSKLLNSSLQATFLNYYPASSSGTIYKTSIFSNTSDALSNYAFCISPNITMKVSGILTYSKTAYSPRDYIFDATLLSNATQFVNLYLAPTASTDILTLTVVDQSNTPVKDALVIVQKQNIGGTPDYISINQFKTDSNGQGITDVILYTTFYRYLVYVNGELKLTTAPSKESSTTRTLQINTGGGAAYNNFLGVNGTISWDNSSQIASFNYMDNSGKLTNSCIYAYLLNNTKYTEYNHQCSTLSSGVITLSINQNGTYLVEGIAYVDNGFYGIVDYKFVEVNEINPNAVTGSLGQVITIISLITVVAVGAATGSVLLGMALLVAVLFFAWNLGFIAFSLYTTGGALIVLAIMIILIAYRRFIY